MRNFIEWLAITGGAAISCCAAYRAGRLHERHAPQATIRDLLKELKAQ